MIEFGTLAFGSMVKTLSNGSVPDMTQNEWLNNFINWALTAEADIRAIIDKETKFSKSAGVLTALSDFVEANNNNDETGRGKALIALIGEIVKVFLPAPILSSPFGLIDLTAATLTGLYMGNLKGSEIMNHDEALLNHQRVFTEEESIAVIEAFVDGFLETYTKSLSHWGDMFNKREQVIISPDDSHDHIIGYSFFNPNENTKVVIAALNNKDTYIRGVDGSNLKIIVGSFSHANTIWGGSADIISGGSNDDSIRGNGTIYGGEGNDTIKNSGDTVTIDAGADNDYIYSSGDKVTINGGTGDDYIVNYGRQVLFKYEAGDGNDFINTWYDSSSSLQIMSDTVAPITSDGTDIFITVGESTITLEGYVGIFDLNENQLKVRFVNGTEGDDLINNRFSNVIIDGKGGNDTINGFDSTSTLSIAGGYYSTQASGNNMLIKAGENTLTLKNIYAVADTIHINNDLINLERRGIELDNAGESIYAGRVSLSIAGGVGNDSIENLGYSVTIASDEGDDYIENFGESVIIDAGAGNDSIYSWSDNITIAGSADNDLIRLSSYAENNLIQYSSGDGNDTIKCFNSTSTLAISDGTYSTTTSDNDIIVSVGDSSITLVDAASLDNINIINSLFEDDTADDSVDDAEDDSVDDAEDDSVDDAEDDSVDGTADDSVDGTADDDILIDNKLKEPEFILKDDKKFVDASKRTKAIQITGNALANLIVGGKGKDCLTGGAGNDTLWGGKKNDTLTGGDGDDVFIFQAGGGKDIIIDYASGELLQILDRRGDVGTFKKATFKNDTLTLAIQGGGKAILSGVNTSTEFNINGDIYHVAENSLAK